MKERILSFRFQQSLNAFCYQQNTHTIDHIDTLRFHFKINILYRCHKFLYTSESALVLLTERDMYEIRNKFGWNLSSRSFLQMYKRQCEAQPPAADANETFSLCPCIPETLSEFKPVEWRCTVFGPHSSKLCPLPQPCYRIFNGIFRFSWILQEFILFPPKNLNGIFLTLYGIRH